MIDFTIPSLFVAPLENCSQIATLLQQDRTELLFMPPHILQRWDDKKRPNRESTADKQVVGAQPICTYSFSYSIYLKIYVSQFIKD